MLATLQASLRRTTEQESLHSKSVTEDVLGDCAWMGLVDFLDRAKVENFGRGATVEQLLGWNENFIPASFEDFDGANTRAWLADARKQSERLASLQAFFGQLNKATEALNNTLKESISQVSHRIGYENLPNEILLCILRHANCTSKSYRENLSLVCRRFRDLINSEPEFWTSLDNSLHMNIVERHLIRSKNADLSIVLNSKISAGTKLVNFVRKIIPHCHRWKDFTLDFCVDIDQSTLAQVSDLLKDLDLPILREASLTYPIDHHEVDVDDESIRFYTSWNAPCLETIHFGDMYPMVNDTVRLKTITFEFTGMDLSGWYGWTPLLFGEYLSKHPYVESVELEMTNTLVRSFERVLPPEPFDTPTLRTFRFICADCTRGSLETASSILKCLHMPALETLDIRISDRRLTTEDINELFSSGDYSTLKTLLLHVRQGYTDHTDTSIFEPLKVILSRMRNLQHLTLVSPEYETQISVPNPRDGEIIEPPPLRTVHLDDCMGVQKHHVWLLLKWMREGRHWNDFEQIRGSHRTSVEDMAKEYLERPSEFAFFLNAYRALQTSSIS